MSYTWSSAIAKISIALALLRLAVKRSHRVILWSIIGIVIAIGLMFWFVLLFACNPISYFWERAVPTSVGTCVPISTILNVAYFYSTVTIVCDLSLGVLPAFLVWKLQMNRRTKVAVGAILGLGAMYVISACPSGHSETYEPLLTSSQCECGSHLSITVSTLLC
jgi:hypothetical protein